MRCSITKWPLGAIGNLTLSCTNPRQSHTQQHQHSMQSKPRLWRGMSAGLASRLNELLAHHAQAVFTHTRAAPLFRAYPLFCVHNLSQHSYLQWVRSVPHRMPKLQSRSPHTACPHTACPNCSHAALTQPLLSLGTQPAALHAQAAAMQSLHYHHSTIICGDEAYSPSVAGCFG